MHERERERRRKGEGGIITSFFSFSFSAEDDLYLAYATVHSKPSTYLLTNDNQGSVRYYLPEDYHNIFHQWLRTRTARIVRFRKQQCNIQVRKGGCICGGGRWEVGGAWHNITFHH